MTTISTDAGAATATDIRSHKKGGDSASPSNRLFAVHGGQIAYDDTGGNGSLILAIPGMGDLRSEYRLLRPLLAGAGYRVVTMDVRGFGATSA